MEPRVGVSGDPTPKGWAGKAAGSQADCMRGRGEMAEYMGRVRQEQSRGGRPSER